MPYQFFKSSFLATTLPEGTTPPPGGQYIKSNVENVTDGGIILRVQFNENYNIRNVALISGSISSGPAVSQQIAQFVSQISQSSSPFISTTEEDFNTQLSDYETLFNTL
jgi:hypothetical protein